MTIVLAHAPTTAAEAAFGAAVAQARSSGRPLRIINVVSGDAIAGTRAAPQDELESLVERARAEGVSAELDRLRSDDVVGAVETRLHEVGASLLVIGSRRRSAVGKLLLGSVAQRLILTAPCAVLVLKASEAPHGR